MNKEIKIFKAEEEAGLEHLIRSTAAIAYDSPVLLDAAPQESLDKDITSLKSIPSMSKAANLVCFWAFPAHEKSSVH